MTRLRYVARAGVPKSKVCWSVLNVDRACIKESNRIGMEDWMYSITRLCDSYTYSVACMYAFGCKCCKAVLSRFDMMNFHFHYKTPSAYILTQ